MEQIDKTEAVDEFTFRLTMKNTYYPTLQELYLNRFVTVFASPMAKFVPELTSLMNMLIQAQKLNLLRDLQQETGVF